MSALAELVAGVRRDLELQHAAERQRELTTNDPVAFCRDILGFEPWSKQREILESIRDHRRTAVRSGHGTGKTATAARACLWFLASHPHSRVVTTAPTWLQVKDLLWREIRGAHNVAGATVGGTITDTRLEIAADWFAVGLSTDKPERFQGHHAEHLLLIVDEASGVDEAIFEAASGFMTSPHARMLLIGNPTRTSGEFFEAFHSRRSVYNTIRVSVLDTPSFTGEQVPSSVLAQLPSQEWVDEQRDLYGEDSPVYQVRVLGEFPSTSDDTVCALGRVEAAQARDLELGYPTVIGVDVARFGSDETVIAARTGNRVRIVRVHAGQDTMRTAGAIVEVARELRVERNESPVVVVDDVGVGGGVTDRLRELGRDAGLKGIVAFNGGARARQDRDYPNRRSEVWFDFAAMLPEIDLDPDRRLLGDLVAPRYVLDSRGRRVVEAKSDTKKRLNRSPDRADAVLLAFSVTGRTSDGGWERAEPQSVFEDEALDCRRMRPTGDTALEGVAYGMSL